MVEAADDHEAPEPQASVRAGSMAASAMGLTFSVPASVDSLSLTAGWGRYERASSEFHRT
ncbi:MAG TPA: hypothetical protein VG184_07545 [Acidimicrobiales bacterium]|nr:hypothetical protein [Acidimicrobiales bacterium]